MPGTALPLTYFDNQKCNLIKHLLVDSGMGGIGMNPLRGMIDWIKTDKTGDWGKESELGNYTLQVDCIRGADINGLNGRGKVKSPNRFILEKNKHKLLSPFDLVVEISGGSPTQSTGRLTFLTPELFERFENPLICSNFCKAISLKDTNYFYNFKSSVH